MEYTKRCSAFMFVGCKGGGFLQPAQPKCKKLHILCIFSLEKFFEKIDLQEIGKIRCCKLAHIVGGKNGQFWLKQGRFYAGFCFLKSNLLPLWPNLNAI
jgi:hypothetical protein